MVGSRCAARPLPASRVPSLDSTWTPGRGGHQGRRESLGKMVRAGASRRLLGIPCNDSRHRLSSPPSRVSAAMYLVPRVPGSLYRSSLNPQGPRKQGLHTYLHDAKGETEAASSSSHGLLVLVATRVRQERRHAGTAASFTGSPGRQFTSQAGRPAGDCLPRPIGGSRVTHSCVPSPASLGSGLSPNARSPRLPRPARGRIDASRRLRTAHLGVAKGPGR